jgi:hypothetical protein
MVGAVQRREPVVVPDPAAVHTWCVQEKQRTKGGVHDARCVWLVCRAFHAWGGQLKPLKPAIQWRLTQPRGGQVITVI